MPNTLNDIITLYITLQIAADASNILHCQPVTADTLGYYGGVGETAVTLQSEDYTINATKKTQ
jgi:hypothetical protein